MPDLKPFFSVNAWGDSLTTGATLKIVHSLHYSDYNASPHMAPLVELPAAELQEKLEGSKAAEKAIFEKLKAATDEWEAQAAQTLLLEKVLEYVRTPEVSHTSNEWKQIQGGAWEISNRVYQINRFSSCFYCVFALLLYDYKACTGNQPHIRKDV